MCGWRKEGKENTALRKTFLEIRFRHIKWAETREKGGAQKDALGEGALEVEDKEDKHIGEGNASTTRYVGKRIERRIDGLECSGGCG